MSTINYTPRGTFVNDTQPPPVPVNATNLNAMDAGIKAAADGVDRLTPTVTTVTATGTTTFGGGRDTVVIVDATLGNVIIKLPAAVSNQGIQFTVKAVVVPAGVTVTISPQTGDTVEGGASLTLAQGQSVTLFGRLLGVSNGTWYEVADAVAPGSGSISVYNEGVALPPRGQLDIVGSNIVASDVSPRTRITVLDTFMHLGGLGITGVGDEEALFQSIIDANPGVKLAGVSVLVGKPIFAQTNTYLADMNITATAGYAPNDTGKGLLNYHLQAPVSVSTTNGSANITINGSMTFINADGVGVLVAFKGNVPTPLVAGKEYFITAIGATTIQVSATSGGAAITMGANSTCTMYGNIYGMSRGWLENVSLVGNGLVKNGLRANLQQNSETRRMTFRDFAEYGALIDGQISTHYNWRFDFHSDNQKGCQFGGHGHSWYHVDATRSGGNFHCAFQPAGGYACAIYGFWNELLDQGFLRFDSTHPGYGISLYDAQSARPLSVVVASGTGVSGCGYTLYGGRYGSSGDIIIDDQQRGFQIQAGIFPANAAGIIHQASDASYPTIIGTRTETNLSSTYTLVMLDTNSLIRCTNSGAITITVPPASSVPFPPGCYIDFYRWGAGEVAFTPGAGVTLNSDTNMRRITNQYNKVRLYHDAGDTWYLEGQLKV